MHGARLIKRGGGVEKRRLGSTGYELSIVGFGGILAMNETPAGAADLVAEAVARGVNYFDVAPGYGDAEERLGPALEPYRDGVFLACKTAARTRDEATAELRRSLRRLRTDRLDLYQHHGVTTMEEAEAIMGPGGAMEAFLAAREEGLVRLLGFSAHSEEAAMALMEAFPFDTILFPVNWACWRTGFGPRVIEAATEKGLGILALKALARRAKTEGEATRWPKAWYVPVDSYEQAALALRFTLGKPVTAAVSPGHVELFRWACEIAVDPRPLSAEEEEMLMARAEPGLPIFQGGR